MNTGDISWQYASKGVNIKTENRKPTKQLLEEATKLSTDEERIAYFSKNNIQIPDELLNRISGGSDSEGYECEECHAVYDSWWELLIHTFSHAGE